MRTHQEDTHLAALSERPAEPGRVVATHECWHGTGAYHDCECPMRREHRAEGRPEYWTKGCYEPRGGQG